jgi:uncharacterized protein involved in exopolysaccharide biosynthesis
LLVAETRALEALETRIAEAETHKAELEKRLRDYPSDDVLTQKLDAEVQTLNARLECDLERWVGLAEFS